MPMYLPVIARGELAMSTPLGRELKRDRVDQLPRWTEKNFCTEGLGPIVCRNQSTCLDLSGSYVGSFWFGFSRGLESGLPYCKSYTIHIRLHQSMSIRAKAFSTLLYSKHPSSLKQQNTCNWKSNLEKTAQKLPQNTRQFNITGHIGATHRADWG